jgi:shikimate kinase
MGIPSVTRNIMLVGPKHAGKTTIGRELAKRMGSPFVDLDALVEERTGRSPRALFRESPETFRAAELQALESLLSRPPAGAPRVIAAGGGVIDNGGARDLLLAADGLLLVSLEVSAETAWERIAAAAARSGELPPFLDTADPRETHRLLHERRTAAYREIARVRAAGEGRTPGETVREIMRAAAIQ